MGGSQALVSENYVHKKIEIPTLFSGSFWGPKYTKVQVFPGHAQRAFDFIDCTTKNS